VLDIETWVPNVYKVTWRKVDSHIYKITAETEEKLHPTVAPQSLRAVFVRTRQAIVLLHRSEEAKVYEIDFETIYYWLNSHSYVDSGILIDRYLTLVEEAMALSPPSASLEISDQLFESLGTIYTQSALCLAALFAIRDIGQEVRINGIDVVSASTTIVKHLKQAIEQALTHCTPDERIEHRAAHLWCAFVGALSEQRLVLPTEIDPLPAIPERK
jgi:hypothetical protein